MNNLSDLQQQFNDLPGPYLLRVSRGYTPEMDALRCEAFPEANHSATNRDVYDGRAWHLTIHYTDELAAYRRLIPGPDGFFKALTANPLLVDSWKATDWSRLVVAPSFRNLGLPKVMGLVALLVAHALGHRYVHGAASPSRQLIGLLHRLDFREVDMPISVSVQPSVSFCLQLFTCDLTKLTYSPDQRLVESWHQLGMSAMH